MSADSDAADLAQIFSGNRVVAGSHPIAMAYAGHQFRTLRTAIG